MSWDSDYGMRQIDQKTTYWGSDTKGHDIKFFGDTTGKYVHWDASANTLYVVGTLDLTGTFNTGNIALVDNETITFGTGLDVNIKWDGTNLLWSKVSASGNGLKIDADTVDTTSDVLALDVGVNSASVAAQKINLDVGTALSAGEIARGIYIDGNGKAANADTSGLYGVDVLLTATSTDRADIIGYKVAVDGTMDGADTIKGMLIDLDTTLSTSTLYGLHIDGSGITHTNATLYGIYNDVSAAVTAGTSVAEFIKLSAAATGISIDGGTNDSTAGNAITIDWDVNSSNSNMIAATIDVGTALSAGEIVKGVYLDITGKSDNANTSGIYGIDMAITGIASGAEDFIGYKVLFDGTKNAGDSTKGLLVDGDLTINNASETLYGAHFDFSGTTHTDGTLYGTYTSLPLASSGNSYGHFVVCNTTNEALHINSDTTDRTSGYCINIDLGVNNASCGGIYQTIDWGTASASTAKTVRGFFQDINDIASGFNGSAMIGNHVLMTGVASGNSDLQAFKAEFDGTRNQGDFVVGLFVDNNQTINNANEEIFGTRVLYDGVTHTSGKAYGHYVDISQVVTAGSNYGLYESLGLYGVGLYMTGTAGKSVDSMQITANAGKANFDAEIDYADRWEIFDDFNYQTIAATYTPWILTSGLDAQATDPTIATAERGTVQLVTGNADGTVANDGSQIICSVPVQADSGGLIAETRLYIDTAITEISVWFGFTDANTLEEPVTNAADSLTFVADDAAVFHFDDGATTKQWFAAAVDSTTADANNGATGSAPVAGTYQKLRIEVSSDGATIKFYVNDTLVKTLSGDAGVTPNANLYCTVGANATTTTSKTVVVDYIKVGHNR